ncbi:VOC family protein [Actinacidiphila oryziradicis]|uniref:hypothetical protein n=1 Tax=Actinacidiphila oryziradicis TaxID=2571141 RepID=UPI001B809B2B|nr:hypothetical protein [Actinacidiphila oryziradicis]
MTPRFEVVGLVVTNMAASLAFYRLLGLDIAPEADNQPHTEAALPGGLRLVFDTTDTIRSFHPGWAPPQSGGLLSRESSGQPEVGGDFMSCRRFHGGPQGAPSSQRRRGSAPSGREPR